MATIRITFLAVLFSTALLSCSAIPSRTIKPGSGDYSQLREQMTLFVHGEMKKHRIPGISIALIDGQQTLWEQGFGMADREAGVAATPDTAYRVASLTKLFTACAIMQLTEEGKVDLDRPVTDYIPEFSIKSRFAHVQPITVRMLMTHHSGIPSDRGEGLFSEKPESFESIIPYLRDQYLSYPPGYMYCYSNLGVALLGIVIERVSGQKYEDYVTQRILIPLGMTSSFFYYNHDGKNGIARDYSEGEPAVGLDARDVPSVSLISSAVDLKKFMMMVSGRGRIGDSRILGEETLDSMMRQQNKDNPLDFDVEVGLIWNMGRKSLGYSGRIVMHRGISLNHRSIMMILPDEGLGITVLSNSSQDDDVVGEIADRALTLALETKKGAKPSSRPGYRVVPLDDKSRTLLPGCYATLKGPVLIKTIDDSLWIDIMGKTFKMIPHEDGMFGLQYVFLGFIPDSLRVGVTLIGGKKILVLEHFGQKTAVGEEYRVAAVPDIWKKRCGRYRIINNGKNFRLFDDDLRLYIRSGVLTGEIVSNKFSIGKLLLVLDPITEDEAVIRGLGRSAGETLFAKVSQGTKEILEYSGYLFEKVE